MSTADDYWPAPLAPGATELTIAAINAALVPVSREHGYCLCMRPLMDVINFAEMSRRWCQQPVTNAAWSPDAKTIRTAAVKAAYPQFIKKAGAGE